MVNVGIDFGSTNTTIAIYRSDRECPEALTFGLATPYIPSIVSYNKKNGEYSVGVPARSHTGKKSYDIYKAFKMLIPENNPKVLLKRGYTEEKTPQVIAAVFIEKLLKKALIELGEEQINKLVIGVPEIWREQETTVDGIPIIREILESISFVNKVEVASEPEAATAYFAHNYKKKTNEIYNGQVLLVDYGGGTLDITLTEVSGVDDSNIQIKTLERTGAGENVDGNVGKAGIVYMETVVTEALKRADLLDNDTVPEADSNKFYKAVYEFETQIQNSMDEICAVFSEYEGIGIEESVNELEEEEFTTIEYKGEDIEITYGLLVDVYNRVIRDVLNEKLKEIESYMISNRINYRDPGNKSLKIALVGGFGRYYLVEEQIKRFFKFKIQNDKRQENIFTSTSDCEQAISLGTALLANDVIGIKHTAPYSIGYWAFAGNGREEYVYAFKIRQEIKYDTEYFIKGNDGNNYQIFAMDGSCENIFLNLHSDDRYRKKCQLKEEYLNKLRTVVNNPSMMIEVSFSISKSEVLTIHVYDYDEEKMRRTSCRSIKLARIKDLLDQRFVS